MTYHCTKPATVELSDIIARMGQMIARGVSYDDEEMLCLHDMLKGVRAPMHDDLADARRAGLSLRRGANVVPLTDFQRAERAFAGLPCDTEGAA